ncbi:hypothetical protein QUB08_23900 [Microcoleus sp. BR0-C5]|uniref:hypothetical protein n=1 Tax=Microcoleus sp. BR0-C5 TaxID=2818713 RepID=UPI002FCFC8A8
MGIRIAIRKFRGYGCIPITALVLGSRPIFELAGKNVVELREMVRCSTEDAIDLGPKISSGY